MRKNHLLTFACSTALIAAPALAQDFFDHNGPDPAAIPSWPVTVPTNQVIVVTKAQPGKRHSCQLGSLTAEALTCVGKHGNKPVVYQTVDVEALINPRFHTYPWLIGSGILGFGACVIYAATLTNPAGAVVLGVVAAYLILSVPFAVGFSYGEETPDRLLYLAPEHKLSVVLRK